MLANLHGIMQARKATNFADAPKASEKHGATTKKKRYILILLPKTVLMEF
jgi:hypothetical protein